MIRNVTMALDGLFIIGNHGPRSLSDADIQRLRVSYLRSRRRVISERARAKYADPERAPWPVSD